MVTPTLAVVDATLSKCAGIIIVMKQIVSVIH